MTDLIIIQAGAVFPGEYKRIFDAAESRFVQTTEHPFIKRLGLGGHFVSMDDLYESSSDYDELNRSIAGRLVEAAEFMSSEGYSGILPGRKNAAYVTLGRVNPDLLREIHAAADAGKVNLEVLPFIGFAESAYAAALSNGLL